MQLWQIFSIPNYFLPTILSGNKRKKPKVKEKKIKKEKKPKTKKNSQRKERKATQTLAVVLGKCIQKFTFDGIFSFSATFLVCWVPFFTCNILDALSIKYNLNTSPGNFAFQATTLLGYINSCLNPLIYTIFNPEFRKAFKRLLGFGHWENNPVLFIRSL